jgi:hypothetical protein
MIWLALLYFEIPANMAQLEALLKCKLWRGKGGRDEYKSKGQLNHLGPEAKRIPMIMMWVQR